jgi:hypothetical protein
MEYCDILANKNHFLNLENPTWSRLTICTTLHSIKFNTLNKREMFSNIINEVKYMDLGKKGNPGNFSNK